MNELQETALNDLLEKAKETVQHFDEDVIQLLEINGQVYIISIKKYISASDMLKKYSHEQ